MYRSIYYDHSSNKIYLDDDEQGRIEFQYKPQVYKRIKEYQEGALPVLTGGYAVPYNQKYEKGDISILEQDISPEIRVLRDLYYKYDETLPQNHKIIYLDIECEIVGKLDKEAIEDPKGALTSIALLDISNKQKICFVVDKEQEIENINENNKLIIPCKSEKDLCIKFLKKWEELDATIVVTYNGKWFDIPYLYYRLCRVIGREEASRLSPIGKMNVQTWNPNDINVSIGGINHLDYMLLHKKYIMKEEPSYKLKDIGEKYVNLTKIEYEGTLNQLFKEDKNKFIEYNLRDVEILEKLEDKLKFVELTILISHICNIPYEQVYHSTVLGEGAILKELKREGIISPNKPNKTNPNLKEETYAGGYLLEIEPNIYEDCIDEDVTSLYPSIIKSLNIGIETLVGRIKVDYKPNYEQNHSLDKLKLRDPNEVIIIERLNKNNYKLESSKINIGKLINIIENNNYSITPSGAFFNTDKESVSSKILKKWFEKREYYRELKKKAGKKEDWSNFKLYDGYQHSFKILQNSHYGTYAKVGWRYTDGHMICSSGITNSGQVLTKTSVEFTNNLFQKELPRKNNYVFLSDTDSIYVELKDIINKRFGNIEEVSERNKKLIEIGKELQDKINANINDIAPLIWNISPTKHYFSFKQEVVAKTILTTGKRRYGMWIVNKEGVDIPPDHSDALDLKGLELIKSNSNPLFKEFGTNFIKQILFKTPKSQLDQLIIDLYKKIKTLDPKTLGKPTGVSYINKCVKKSPSPGEILSELHLNTKPNSSGSIYYNDLLRFKGLNRKFPEIIEGAKVYVIDLIKNPYNINYISIPVNEKIPDFMEDFIKKYADIDKIFESSILNKLKELYKDLGMEFPNLNPNISKFFKFS